MFVPNRRSSLRQTGMALVIAMLAAVSAAAQMAPRARGKN